MRLLRFECDTDVGLQGHTKGSFRCLENGGWYWTCCMAFGLFSADKDRIFRKRFEKVIQRNVGDRLRKPANLFALYAVYTQGNHPPFHFPDTHRAVEATNPRRHLHTNIGVVICIHCDGSLTDAFHSLV